MVFDYVESWLTNPTAIPLSQSLPLTKKHFTRDDCRGFFAGVLPDESKREIIAHNLGISARNDFAMLERIGGECAGAVTFIPEGISLPEPDNQYRPLSAQELADIIVEGLKAKVAMITRHAAVLLLSRHGLFTVSTDLLMCLDATERINWNAWCILARKMMD